MIVTTGCHDYRNAMSFNDSHKTSDMKLLCPWWKRSTASPPSLTEDMRPPSPFQTTVHEIRRLSIHGHEHIMESERERRALIDATQRLVHIVQTPEEAVRNNAFSPTYNACVRIAIDLDLFRILSASRRISAADLASATGAECELIVRLMRILCGIGFVSEVGKLHYAQNSVTRHMTVPATAASIIHFFDQGLPSIANLPQFFKEHGYASPDDYEAGPFQFGHETDLESYAYWLTKPEVINNFDTFMNGGKLGNQRRWTDWFPTNQVIVDDYRGATTGVMLVDVAGGRGHDIEAFYRKHLNAPGRLVLEDLPETMEQIRSLSTRIEPCSHNFFEPQPVQGARAYFLQDIFHNWPTSVARLILRHIKNVMIPGYSKLLISELVLPDEQCPLPMAGLDWGMMFLHSGLERSEQQWRDLLACEGLEVVRVHHEPGGDGAIIEAVIPC